MAKTTAVSETDPTVVAKATELKKELQRLVRAIAEDDDFTAESIDQAKDALSSLKELKMRKRSLSLKLHEALSCPEEFRCPLSKELMKDPVIVSSGQTYDRAFIQKWLKSGKRTCPRTQQVLSDTSLIPNHLIREMISQWCKSRGLEFSDPANYIYEDAVTEADEVHLISLLEKVSSSVSEQREAAKELRLLTKRMPSFRALFGKSESAIPQLLIPLSQCKSQTNDQLELQEDLVTTLLNISIHDDNKKLVAETPEAISLLMDALRTGTVETRSNAAAALFTLSALDSNKALIGEQGALKLLTDLLEEGHPSVVKDVASAIFTLCVINENKSKAVEEGAVRVILEKLANRMYVDELLAILAMLSSNLTAVEEMGKLGAVPCLLNIIRESTCDRNKENCIAILHTICCYNRTKLREIREEENANRTISELAKSGTSRAKRKASGILERLKRTANLTHTA